MAGWSPCMLSSPGAAASKPLIWQCWAEKQGSLLSLALPGRTHTGGPGRWGGSCTLKAQDEGRRRPQRLLTRGSSPGTQGPASLPSTKSDARSVDAGLKDRGMTIT